MEDWYSDGGLVFGWRIGIRMEDGRWRGRCEGEREVPLYGRGRVRYPEFSAATLELSPSYGRAKVSVRSIKVFMAPARQRRRWRQETLEFRSSGRLNCLAEHVSNYMTETELLGAGLLTGFFGVG